MPLSIESLIDRLGGPDAAAKLTAVSTEAVRKWRSTGAIPSRHWPIVLAATGLSLDDLPGGVNHDAPTHKPDRATAALVLGDGRIYWGIGFGAYSRPDHEAAELCFSTGMAGYQETLTDPSFAGQIITFTFPHIGNVGSNAEDIEASQSFALGLVLNRPISKPSNWRSTAPLEDWCARMGLPGIHSVDTRALTISIREDGAPNALLAYPQDQKFDIPALVAQARDWPGLTGMDLARAVSCTQPYEWTETLWDRATGFGHKTAPTYTVVAVDYGAKRNIFRNLASAGCRVIVVPATSTAEDILRHQPDGVFLSNGPGDPAATAHYAVPTIRRVLETGLPLFGICLGHQLLATALGGKTYKLARGHRGANQPVQDLATGRVEITSQNHGFAVDEASLPHGVTITHRSLFDGSNEGIACPAQNCFSVQYHPEASPGPSDANHLFTRFTAMMRAKR
ncbi:MAG TPA: glutamine-hydrolyzing carbamoyl-phosphate synthase small subunit [Acidiphilium sp.]|nr:MAG: carbamoyl phosphate synthase small subunit [Acidiphilium sp. 21-60-14]OYV91653.1 MAG: carbamoyl phosphate synthase small subunit [Acidiphilium sp. 37-60-79]OZB41046.1 MAG: carbamoyl phosphate synthase small subunit [Acidiphilium sp. 34-60-192]HQT87709.1 glutamine-hydrolyzing carbamoyl-phosphate synthase small subunit [Acidiphilium sp.]HQU22836.1 glutamine-hydrolyzing carbamoyl-phosphate synthase small subunit [Acidiphilium sp.]